jgi:hypothetical protein
VAACLGGAAENARTGVLLVNDREDPHPASMRYGCCGRSGSGGGPPPGSPSSGDRPGCP